LIPFSTREIGAWTLSASQVLFTSGRTQVLMFLDILIANQYIRLRDTRACQGTIDLPCGESIYVEGSPRIFSESRGGARLTHALGDNCSDLTFEVLESTFFVGGSMII